MMLLEPFLNSPTDSWNFIETEEEDRKKQEK